MKNPCKLNVMVLEAQPVARFGLVRLIDSHDRFHTCAEAESTPDARGLCARYRPALAVLDLGLHDGFNLVKELPHLSPGIRIVVFTALADALSVQRALRAGALGYVTRHDPVSELMTAMTRAADGCRHVAPSISQGMLDHLACGALEIVGSEESTLSDRELEIFHAIGRGLGTRTIAEALRVSVKTVETHRQHIKQKLNLRDGCDLQRRAVLYHHAAAAF